MYIYVINCIFTLITLNITCAEQAPTPQPNKHPMRSELRINTAPKDKRQAIIHQSTPMPQNTSSQSSLLSQQIALIAAKKAAQQKTKSNNQDFVPGAYDSLTIGGNSATQKPNSTGSPTPCCCCCFKYWFD